MDPAPTSLDVVHFFLSIQRLMRVFEITESLSQSTKRRIRHRIWARLNEINELERIFSDRPKYEKYVVMAVLAGSCFSGTVFAFFWPIGQSVPYLRFGAICIAVLVSASGFIAIAKGLSRFELRYAKALYPSMAALLVLLIRSLPIMVPHIPQWFSVGIRSGLTGSLVMVVTFGISSLTPWDRLLEEKRWSRNPEANIVIRLLETLDYLEQLGQLERRQDERILESREVHRRRNEKLETLRTEHVLGYPSTNIIRKPDGTVRETYKVVGYREGGEWETLVSEERTLFSFEPKLLEVRQSAMRSIKSAADSIEHGLSGKLRVGEARVDEWMCSELSSRAQAVKAWSRRIVLPSNSERLQLLTQVAAAIEHATDQDWAAMPRPETPQVEGGWQRLRKFVRKAIVGMVPLGFVLGASPLGLAIPPPLRDSLLTFAIPWLLLQLIELLAPDAGDHLSRSKGIRDLLPKSMVG